MRHWLRIKAVTRTSAVVGATWGVLVASVMMGLQVPVWEVIQGLRNRGLDYSASPGSINPLSEEFIERVLGPRKEAEPAGFSPSTKTVAGVVGDERSVVKHLSTNDEPATAFAIGSIPFTAQTDLSQSSRSGDPDECSSSGNTVWYSYRPVSDVGLIAYTFGTKHAVDLAAFEHRDGGWHQVSGACHHGEYGNALIHFPAKKGTVYYFQVASPPGKSDLRFSLDPRGTTRLVSSTATGQPASLDAALHNASPDGRLVAFVSASPGLVDRDVSCRSNQKPPYGYVGPQDRYNCNQVYVRDVVSGRTTLVSAAKDGVPGDSGSKEPFLSGNKRFVVFNSLAGNLAPNNPDGFDLYVKDLEAGTIEMIVSSAPLVHNDASTQIATRPAQHALQNYGNTGPWWPTMSDDGRFVAFQSILPLLPDDNNEGWDVYVFDRTNRTLERASVSSSEQESERIVTSDGSTQETSSFVAPDLSPYISATGRFVVFRSPATNLVERRTNGKWHTFVRDRLLGTTELVSVNSLGEEANERSIGRRKMRGSSISADGRFVVFDSLASNLDESDQAAVRVFMRDRLLGTTRRIGASRAVPQPGNLTPAAHVPSISRNGRFITYTAGVRSAIETVRSGGCTDQGRAANWIFCVFDVLVYDVWTDTTIPVTQLDVFAGMEPVVSEDGRLVSFQSDADGSEALQIFTYEAARAR